MEPIDRADRICTRYESRFPGWEAGAVSETTVRDEIKIRRSFHREIPPLLRHLPAGRLLAMCSFVPRNDPEADTSPTTTCVNDDSVSTFQPRQLLVDETGDAIPELPDPKDKPRC